MGEPTQDDIRKMAEASVAEINIHIDAAERMFHNRYARATERCHQEQAAAYADMMNETRILRRMRLTILKNLDDSIPPAPILFIPNKTAP